MANSKETLKKIKTTITHHIAVGSLTPGEARKLRGQPHWTSLAMSGKVGRGGLRPLLQREYSDRPPWSLSNALRASLHYFLELQDSARPRDIPTGPQGRRLWVAATDGEAEKQAAPSLGYCLACPQGGTRVAGYAKVPQSHLEKWAPKKQVICLVELAAVATLLAEEEALLQNSDVILFVDNSAAVSAYIKGRSGCPQLDALAQQIHLTAYRTDTRLWMEYVETTANWADGVSRRGLECPWAYANGFTVRTVRVPKLP